MSAVSLDKKLVRSWIPKRRADSHKGDYGHTLIVAGSRGMVGAGILSAGGALRGGSGLVTLATVQSQQTAAAVKLRPEAMTLGLQETNQGSLSAKNLAFLLQWIGRRRATSLVIGPGLSRQPETAKLVRALLSGLDQNPYKIQGIVLDADGFLSLGQPALAKIRLPIIVTPHAGEMEKFTGRPTGEAERARILAAEKFARLYRAVCVLKGHRTVVTDGSRTYLNMTGNPGMARGGSGDVLSGLIGALVAQCGSSLYLLRAACAGVFVHGLAGDLAAKQKSQIAMLPGDLAEQIPMAFKKFL